MAKQASLYECRRVYEHVFGKPLPPDMPYHTVAMLAVKEVGLEKVEGYIEMLRKDYGEEDVLNS